MFLLTKLSLPKPTKFTHAPEVIPILINKTNHLYYWFAVGEGTLPLHHLISDYTRHDQAFYHLTTAESSAFR
jgi:hypothetical protein